jgi:membrane-associated protein
LELLQQAVDFVLHLDAHLTELVATYGQWVYGLLAVVIFMETGVVFTPFLPGDSLLFAAGTVAANGVLLPEVLCLLLATAAILGDTSNYWIGRLFGGYLIRTGKVKRAYLDRTHAFFEKYGGKTIIIARFVPIVRTFAPFVAGVGAMTYVRFLLFSVAGNIMWVLLFVWLGFWFGKRPFVKEHYSLVIVAIIIISVMPAVVEYARHRFATRRCEPERKREAKERA